ncbi:unnamed protein product [Ectocarpus sp. 6 AP-2014]
MLQLLEAIEYLHSRWIIHRDLKMSNLLYNNQGQLKLADFGLARTFGHPVQPMTPKVVTLWYRCPELLLGCDTYSTAVDLWAAGCILGELLLGKPLMPGKTDLDQVHKIFKLLGAPNERIWPSLLDLPNVRSGKIDVLGVSHRYNTLGALLPHVRKEGIDLLNEMLTYDPDKRLSARQALRHQYFLNKPLPKSKDVMPTFPTRHGPEPAKLKMSSKGQQASSSSSWVMGASKSKSSSNSAGGSGRRGGGLLPTAGGEGRPAAVATRTSASSSSAAGAGAAAASGSSGGAHVGSSSATATGGARREDAEELREGDGEGSSSSRRAVGAGGSEGSVPLKKPRR